MPLMDGSLGGAHDYSGAYGAQLAAQYGMAPTPPVWAMDPTNMVPYSYPTPFGSPMGAPMAPGMTPTMPTTEMPEMPKAPKVPDPTLAAAPPMMANATGGMTTANQDLRGSVMKQLYRYGKHMNGPVGDAFMGMGAPPQAPDPLAALNPPQPEPERRPMPQLPPSPMGPNPYAMNPQGPNGPAGPAGPAGPNGPQHQMSPAHRFGPRIGALMDHAMGYGRRSRGGGGGGGGRNGGGGGGGGRGIMHRFGY